MSLDSIEVATKKLYAQIVASIITSGLPLVYVNGCLDLIKKDLLEQLNEGLFKKVDNGNHMEKDSLGG